MEAVLARTDAVVFGMARTARKRLRDYLCSALRTIQGHNVIGIVPFLARVQVHRNSCRSRSAEACTRAGNMNRAPHINIVNRHAFCF